MSKYERLEPVFAELDSGDEHIHPMFNTGFDEVEVAPRRKTPFLVIGSLLILAFAGGGLVFAYKQGVREGNRTAPPIIKASTKPIKTAPKKPGGIKIPNQNKRVYDRLDKKPVKLTERLMPSAEEIMDLPKKPAIENPPQQNDGILIEKPQPTAADAVSPVRETPPDTGEGTAVVPETREVVKTAPLPTHEVEVFTITPDGVFPGDVASGTASPARADKKRIAETRVEPEAAPIPIPLPTPASNSKPVSSALPESIPKPPVQIGELPEKADGKSLTERLLETENRLTRRSDDEGETAGAVTGTTRMTDSTGSKASDDSESSAPAIAATRGTMRVAGLPPIPRRKPEREFTAPPKSSAKVLPVRAAPAAPENKVLPALGRGRFVVQIASHRRQADALAEFAGLKRRFPEVIGNYKPSIQRADLGDRGIYYRLRIGPLASKADAARFCESLKTTGKNDCLIRRR